MISYFKMFFFLVLVAFAGVFASRNSELVEINLYPIPFTFSAASFLVIFISIIIGVLIGGFLSSFKAMFWKRVASSREKKIQKLKTEKQNNSTALSTEVEDKK